MLRLGKRYGISGNGLKKICDRLQVPYPPLGYWAKLRATDVPCFRLVKDLGGHSIAVFQPHSARAKSQSKALLKDGRVNFIAPADYRDSRPIDAIVKAIMEKVAANRYVERFEP